MKYTPEQLWHRFQEHYVEFSHLGLAVDISRMNFPDDFLASMEPRMQSAFHAMDQLEAGAIANPDEKRMVGHYWLRSQTMAPSQEIRAAIQNTLADIKFFVARVHSAEVIGAGGCFKRILIVGIGGSALGPQFIAHALGHPKTDRMKVSFFDNTDPDGMDKVLAGIGDELGSTLTVVISKSGGTKETRNGMLEAEAAYRKAGLDFAKHAVAVTGVGSELDKHAISQGWLKRFPMWDWVGGRTSVMSAVGLLPAALQGFNIDEMLTGAWVCDDQTRTKSIKNNPAALLALMWSHAGNGKGSKDMVILPYKDRLELFSKYLQQLIMESLGKELDLNGNKVQQGIAVYGNKGSTDQHAYVQQLRDGVPNFFATFIEVLKDRNGPAMDVEPSVTSGDYLEGFFLGTRSALYENDRESITLTINEVSAFSVGVLIALYERAVGLYASLVNINAYHQPGVEAGKKAATEVLGLQKRVLEHMNSNRGKFLTSNELAVAIGASNAAETLFKVLTHLAANAERGVLRKAGSEPTSALFGMA